MNKIYVIQHKHDSCDTVAIPLQRTYCSIKTDVEESRVALLRKRFSDLPNYCRQSSVSEATEQREESSRPEQIQTKEELVKVLQQLRDERLCKLVLTKPVHLLEKIHTSIDLSSSTKCNLTVLSLVTHKLFPPMLRTSKNQVCLDRSADMVFIPCGHIACCMECTRALRTCPICRVKIDKAVRTYTS